MIQERIIRAIKKYGFIEREIGDGKQITIFEKDGVYRSYLEKWNDEIGDWEVLCEFATQTDLKKLIDSIVFMFGL